MNAAFGKGIPHVQGELVILAAVRLIRDDDDVRPVRQLRIRLALFGTELLDQGEEVAVVFCIQERFEVLRTLCPDALFVFEDCTRRSKVPIDLPVEIIPIRDD